MVENAVAGVGGGEASRGNESDEPERRSGEERPKSRNVAMWVGGGYYPAPALPNRTGGSPASGFPVSGHRMDWLRLSTQGVRKRRTSRAVVANPLTPAGRSTVELSQPNLSPMFRRIRTQSLAALSEPF